MENSRPVVSTLKFHTLVVEHALNAINRRCWENGDDTPSDYLDPEILQTVKDSLERIHETVAEIETANLYFDHTYESTAISDKCIDDLVSTRRAA